MFRLVNRWNKFAWLGQLHYLHILKRLQLIDQSRRKHHVGGKLYAIERREVLDMMQRCDVLPINEMR